MRIAIVNDLAVACEALRRVVVSDPQLSIAWIARDGAEAIERAARDKPDVILMDLIMPRVNGVEATREIMRVSPCPILVVTATVSGNAGLVYEALGAGALDAVNTPTVGALGVTSGGAELLKRVHLVARSAASSTRSATVMSPVVSPAASREVVSKPDSELSSKEPIPTRVESAPRLTRSHKPVIVAIGASTGGPRAVAEVLAGCPRDLHAAFLIVQHVSVDFVDGYAQWLAAETRRNVMLARSGHELRAGDVLVAGEERHCAVTRLGAIEYRDEPQEHLHRPAVDELFRSLTVYPQPGVAVLLTGMGRDGAEGLLALRHSGWHTIAQDEKSSVVWGMPGAAHRMGAATETVPLSSIGAAMTSAVFAILRRIEMGR